jgi:hypothetical protein
MRYLTRKVWSHAALKNGKPQYVRDVRLSTPAVARTYRGLVTSIARISYHNRHSSLFFRGQDGDYTVPKKGSTALPTIFRHLSVREAHRAELQSRFDRLKEADRLLAGAFKKYKIEADTTLNDYYVVRWAILQHYEVCSTPLLDLTTSLRVACSFALRSQRDTGILLVFGLPDVNGSISFYVEEDLINLKLLSICPPSAFRPHFQEGYLAGSLPAEYHYPYSYSPTLDLGRRLVAKFSLEEATFWDSEFQSIPDGALFPENDRVANICEEIKIRLR